MEEIFRHFARSSDKRVRRLLRSSSAVTAPSTYLLEQMCQYRQDMVLLPNPLDLAKYPFRRREHPTPNLVWLRAFHDIYNPSLAVRVVALLVQDFPSVRLVMIGPDKGDGSREVNDGPGPEAWCSGSGDLPGPGP